MYIKKLEILSFGCYENKILEFKEGFNLIYGKNESGKSTIFAFIIYMFYGLKIKKKPGALSFKERYTPWNGNPMHGRVTFGHDGKVYVLERLTSTTKTIEKLYSLNTGEEIKDREILSAPGEYFFGVDAENFFASAFYSGDNSGVLSAVGEGLIAKLTNSVENSSTEISYNKIVDDINEEISNLTSYRRKNASIPLTEEKLRTKKRELFQIQSQNSQVQKLLAENRKYQSDIEKYNKEISVLRKDNNALENEKEPITERNVYRYVLGAFSTLLLTLCLFKRNLFCIAALGVFLLVLLSFELRRMIGKRAQNEAIYTKFFTMQQNNDKIVLLTEKIADIKACIVRNEERSASGMQNDSLIESTKHEVQALEEELSAFKKEVEALELAKLAVTNAYSGYKELFVPKLSRISGDILRRVTDGKYSSALVDDSLKMTVEDTYGYKNALSLSKGATYQAGLSLHLALSDMILSENNTPLFLDDALAFYDDDRATTTMDYLILLSFDRQVFFSTCRKNEADVLKNKNINFINLNV